MASQALDIRSGFSNRTLFITGGTGFVGKVALYKILKEFPDVKCIYLLMRGKKSRKFKRFLNAQERLDLEVMGSPCFDPIRKSAGDAKWKQLCQRVKAVDGDITRDHVGLSEEARATLAGEVQLIIHLAATVNFNERLDLAVQMNTLGGMRVLALAKTCQKLEAMVHVSTCYVNYPRFGRDSANEEKIYPLSFDPENMVKHILGLHSSEVDHESARLLKEHNFANTYTFTKNIGEQLIYRYKGDVPVVVVRPSIIGCSYYEPVPGWVDALTAAGGLILTSSLGVVRELVCDEELVADVIPVDMVVNVILKALFKTQVYHKAHRRRQATTTQSGNNSGAVTEASASTATAIAMPPVGVAKPGAAPAAHVGRVVVQQQQQQQPATSMAPLPLHASGPDGVDELPFIYQVATSGSENRITWGRLTRALRHYMASTKRHPKALCDFDVTLTKSNMYYQLRYSLLRYAPYLALKAYVNLPPPAGSPKKRQLVEKLGKAVRRADLLNREFCDFVTHEWIYTATNSRDLDEGLNDASKKAFYFDPYTVNWYVYARLYTYGIYKYIVRDTGDFTPPEMPMSASEAFFQAASL